MPDASAIYTAPWRRLAPESMSQKERDRAMPFAEVTDFLRPLAQTTASFVEGIGVLIIAIAGLRTLVDYLRHLLARAAPFPPEELRLELGRSLALALEFQLGADILRTAVDPTWDEIARLAAIAAIRTALNYFLQREIVVEASHVGAARHAVLGRPRQRARPAEDRPAQ